jgi:phosphoglycerol transferase MdoB-like AlkP superfamily enzyme
MNTTTPTESGDGLGTLVLLILLGGYFLPFLVALIRSAANSGMIFFANMLLGWTVLGWFVCLLWAGIGQTNAQKAFYEAAARKRRDGE